MSKWGGCDYKQLKALQERLTKLQSVDLDRFCVEASKELAARLLALVIPATPVGKYPKSTGKKGGTLRRGWTAKNEGEATGGSGKGADPVSYAATLPIEKKGAEYVITVLNPVEYASYVEFGHRTAGGNGWVQGQYFLTISENELNKHAPAIIERKLSAMLREVFNG